MQEGLLQFLQGGEFAFVEVSEVLGFYAQDVGGLLAVFNAGIAQQAGESEGQQKLSGLMQDSQLPRRRVSPLEALRSMLGPTDAASGNGSEMAAKKTRER